MDRVAQNDIPWIDPAVTNYESVLDGNLVKLENNPNQPDNNTFVPKLSLGFALASIGLNNLSGGESGIGSTT